MNNIEFFGVHRTLAQYNLLAQAWNIDRSTTGKRVIYTSNRGIRISDIAVAANRAINDNYNYICMYILCGIHGRQDGNNYLQLGGTLIQFNSLNRDLNNYQMTNTSILVNYSDERCY